MAKSDPSITSTSTQPVTRNSPPAAESRAGMGPKEMAAASSTATAPAKTTADADPVPVEICGYTVHAPLGSTNACYLCIGPGGRGVVLKKMSDECIVNGLLHPSIRERLSRV